MVDSGNVCLHDHRDYGRTETESRKHEVKRLVLHVVATFCPWTLAFPEINIPVGPFTGSQKIKHGAFCSYANASSLLKTRVAVLRSLGTFVDPHRGNATSFYRFASLHQGSPGVSERDHGTNPNPQNFGR